MTKQITRIGAYGLVIDRDQIILTTKEKGIYRGLLDLPGGGIEFGETAEEALRRELLEEITMDCSGLVLFDNFSYCGAHISPEGPYQFHHLGLIYHVKGFKPVAHLIPEDIFNWYSFNQLALHQLALHQLTPLAQQVMIKLNVLN